MKHFLEIDTEKYSKEEYNSILDILYNNNINNQDPGQQTLRPENKKKYNCNNPTCKKEITKDVVAFCLFKDEFGRMKYDGKVYCRECQTKMNEGGA